VGTERGRVIAIDGPSGAGKSTVAKLLSDMLGFRYLDTGALYRAVALALMKKGVGPEESDEGLRRALEGVAVEFTENGVILNSSDVSEEIRTTEVGHYSSVFSARRPVREFLLPVQRDAARGTDLVAEGRDMSTVVFPDAWRKLYLDASTEARAERRHQQLSQGGVNITMEEAARDVSERDQRDSSRSLAPLRRAEDAVFIDTTGVSLEDVMKKVLAAVQRG
jgi:cytidylate kinase